MVLGIPRARAHLGIDSYGIVVLGGSVIKGEIVHKLLDANTGRIDGETIVQITSHDPVGSTIGINGESGGRLFGYLHKGVVRKFVEAVTLLADGDAIQHFQRESLELVINLCSVFSGSRIASCY